jgi:hypothetical protein
MAWAGDGGSKQAPSDTKNIQMFKAATNLWYSVTSISNILTLLQIHFLRVLMPPVVEACTDQTYPMHPNASTCAICIPFVASYRKAIWFSCMPGYLFVFRVCGTPGRQLPGIPCCAEQLNIIEHDRT